MVSPAVVFGSETWSSCGSGTSIGRRSDEQRGGSPPSTPWGRRFREKRNGTVASISTTTTTTAKPAASAPALDLEDRDEGRNGAEPFQFAKRKGIRNVAVIAHVDHGKTTLVDKLLLLSAQSRRRRRNDGDDGTAAAAAEEEQLNRLMDCGELEKERGITITSKVTRLDYVDPTSGENVVVNCVDTPGHADFCGEVDRILSMVDGVVLVVDAAEGPMTQTKYVLRRALATGLKPIVVLNKCDRSDGIAKIDSGETEDDLHALFDALDASGEQRRYTTLYASARSGWITEDPTIALELAEMEETEGGDGNGGHDDDHVEERSMKALMDCIMEEIPEPAVKSYRIDGGRHNHGDEADISSMDGVEFDGDKFSLAAVTVGYDRYLGRTCTGRIMSGSIAVNDVVTVLRRRDCDGEDDGDDVDGGDNRNTALPPTSVSGLFIFEGVDRKPLADGRAYAGDIVTLSGVPDDVAVGDTVSNADNPVRHPIDTPPLAPPTLTVDFGANNGPLAGRDGGDGSRLSSSKIRSRLLAEADNNVTLKIEKSAADGEKTVVFARGELQLGILIEQMRREGYEMVVSPPKILTSTCPDTGAVLEPYEEVTVDVDSEFSGAVVSSLTGDRRGVLLEMTEGAADGKCRLVFELPSRSLLGFGSEIASATRGGAVVTHLYLGDRPHAGALGTGLHRSKMVSNASGRASSYALSSLSARGALFVAPGEEVYDGMVVGECAKTTGPDLEVNPVRGKETTNMRTQNKDEKIYLPPPKKMTVEELIGYMAEDEVIEVTPKNIRLRKAILDPSARSRASRTKSKQAKASRK